MQLGIMENPFVFSPVLTEVEWQKVPADIGKTILKFVNDKFEEFITSKALFETKNFNLGMYMFCFIMELLTVIY